MVTDYYDIPHYSFRAGFNADGNPWVAEESDGAVKQTSSTGRTIRPCPHCKGTGRLDAAKDGPDA